MHSTCIWACLAILASLPALAISAQQIMKPASASDEVLRSAEVLQGALWTDSGNCEVDEEVPRNSQCLLQKKAESLDTASRKVLGGQRVHPGAPRIAVYMYNIGGYDSVSATGRELPPGIDGFFFTDANSMHTMSKGIQGLRGLGWKIEAVKILNGTKYVSPERITTKYLKFVCPEQLKKYDVVLTHDSNKQIHYASLPAFVASHMKDRDAIFMDWPPPDVLKSKDGLKSSVYDEIDWILGSVSMRTLLLGASQENVINWRAFLKASKYPDRNYFNLGAFMFRPSSQAFARCGRLVFQRTHTIPRDQFILPWALLQEHVNYEHLSQEDFSNAMGLKDLSTRLKRN